MERRRSVQKSGHEAHGSDLATRHWAYHAAVAELQGQRTAVQLYRWLVVGNPPPALPAVAPDGSAIYLDAIFRCASWGGQDVGYQEVSAFPVGSPPLVTASLFGTAVANRRSRQRAVAAARPQWRDHGALRFLVTSTATWCGRGKDWRHFTHSAITGYELDTEASSIALADAPPLRLAGPEAWSHAVLFAYWRYGADRWQHAPFLERLLEASSICRLSVPS